MFIVTVIRLRPSIFITKRGATPAAVSRVAGERASGPGCAARSIGHQRLETLVQARQQVDADGGGDSPVGPEPVERPQSTQPVPTSQPPVATSPGDDSARLQGLLEVLREADNLP